MIEPERLADRLQECAVLLRTQGGGSTLGDLTWQRCDDWTDATMPRLVEPLSDEQEERARAGRSEDDETRRRDEAAAARYKAELSALTKRLEADIARLTRIIGICNPQKPKELRRGDRTAAQVLAEGSCPTCWRIGVDEAITLRPEKDPEKVARPYYKDRCKWCGEWRAEHGQDAPLSILRIHHTPGRHLTTADVAKALGRAS